MSDLQHQHETVSLRMEDYRASLVEAYDEGFHLAEGNWNEGTEWHRHAVSRRAKETDEIARRFAGDRVASATGYEVEYAYYQYNSGAADNGHYVRRCTVMDEAEALELLKLIGEAVMDHAKGTACGEDGEESLVSRLIPWDGYFTGAKAFRVERFALA